MEDWEEDVHVPSLLSKEPVVRSNWDDEDADDNEVKDSWEDDDDEPAPLAPAPKAPAEKAPKKPAAKAAEKKGKAVEVEKEESLDPLAEKLRQQRLVEEADYKATKELFSTRGEEKNIDNFIPKSESDFLEYAELISHKLRPFEKSFHYIGLLKAVMRLSMTSLKGADAKDVASSITAIANEKIKAEKEANAGKKKTGAKKKQLHVDKPDDDIAVDGYDPLDDYDFMIPESLPCLHDAVLASAADAALSVSLNQKKKQSTGPAILGIVKGLKGGKMVQSGDSSHSTATPKSRFDQLEGMFWKSQQLDLVPGLDHQETLELNIDDIEIDEPLHVASTSTSHDVDNKKREGDSERDRLFQGGTGDTKPRVRTAEEIKAKYRKTEDASSVASEARNKLMERGQKLEKLSRRTEDLQNGAEDFASMANELVKTLEALDCV